MKQAIEPNIAMKQQEYINILNIVGEAEYLLNLYVLDETDDKSVSGRIAKWKNEKSKVVRRINEAISGS